MKSRTLTLRLDEHQSAALAELQHQLGEKTASKTLIDAATRYLELLSDNDSLRSDVDLLETEVARLNRVINSAKLAALELLERVGQDDLFSPGTHSDRRS